MRSLSTLLSLVLLTAGAFAEEILRPPVAAGNFYPDHPDALLKELRNLYNQTTAPPVSGHIMGCIVPHSGYEFAGVVAANLFKMLTPGQYDRVIILAPSHFSNFEGCSVPLATGFVTPLGIVPIDTDAVDMLTLSSLISTRSLNYGKANHRQPLHEQEFDIEVLLPFLQERLGYFKLVPILVGSLDDARGKFNPDAAAAVADSIRSIVGERTLLIASSDFTHFGNDYSYRPFNKNIQQQIQGLDEDAFRLIARRDVEGFHQYLLDTGNTICGKASIQVLLQSLPGHTVGKVVGYDMSSRKTGNQDRSVSYGAMVFYDPRRAPQPPNPQPNPLAVPLARMPGAATSLVQPTVTQAEPAAEAPEVVEAAPAREPEPKP